MYVYQVRQRETELGADFVTSETVGAQGHVLVSEKGNDHSGGGNLFVSTQCQGAPSFTHSSLINRCLLREQLGLPFPSCRKVWRYRGGQWGEFF